MRKTFAIVPAAGRGLRMAREQPKQFLTLAGKPILVHTIEKLAQTAFISAIVLVVPADFLTYAEQMLTEFCGRLTDHKPCTAMSDPASKTPNPPEEISRTKDFSSIAVIAGGKERQDSILNALKILPGECDWVLIHDGVRPFVSLRLLDDTWRAAQLTGAAIAALSATDTVKRVDGHHVLETLPREEIKLVQTPQVFRKELIVEAYAKAQEFGWMGTDDASFVERLNVKVWIVEGEPTNIKVTTATDLEWAQWFFSLQKGS